MWFVNAMAIRGREVSDHLPATILFGDHHKPRAVEGVEGRGAVKGPAMRPADHSVAT